MIDFFAGLKGASQYPKELGWKVITVDIEEKHTPDIVWDLSKPGIEKHLPEKIDFCWFSPPCTEFSKDSMPWHEAKVDLTLVFASLELARILKPKYWILENVRGLQRYLGRANFHLGPFYFWGWFPRIESQNKFYFKSKLFPSEDRASLRAKIPFEVNKLIIEKIVE